MVFLSWPSETANWKNFLLPLSDFPVLQVEQLFPSPVSYVCLCLFDSHRSVSNPGECPSDTEKHGTVCLGHLTLWLLHFSQSNGCVGNMAVQVILPRPCPGVLLNRWNLSVPPSCIKSGCRHGWSDATALCTVAQLFSILQGTCLFCFKDTKTFYFCYSLTAVNHQMEVKCLLLNEELKSNFRHN